MGAVLYCRVSTEEQANEGVSLAAQKERLEGYARAFSIEVVANIEDAGVSAKSLDRPGLKRALKMLRAGQADVLAVTKIDRLSRSVGDIASLVDKYFGDRGGKSLISLAENFDTRTASGRMMLNLLAAFGQMERELIAERTRDALQHKKRQGFVLGRAPLGYQLEHGRLVEDAAELEVLERVRALHRDGLSLRQIASQLKTEDRKTKRGGAWHAATLAKLLSRR
jgi:site-specific DNA recombinase